ncbi:hypothetical protein EVA_11201 [gut metagenome]|uniref:Uncharacterized protein n=1 Tax=gut metagenome TaxID=749906 RepID=J9GFX4_9ZZZZ
MLSVLFVLAILQVVLVVVIPEIATTVASLSKNIEAFLPKLGQWIASVFPDGKQLALWINSIEF